MNFDFPQTLILLLIGLLFFKENILSWINKKLGYEEKPIEQVIEKMGGDMTHLRLHFNDDLTRILTEMQVTQVEIKDNQKDGIRLLTDIYSKQNAIIDYGVKIRK